MGVSKKGRRRITIDGDEYLWWVAQDDDCYAYPGAFAVTVVSKDKRFFVRYHLDQPSRCRHVTVLGSVFRALDCTGPWRRFRAPEFGTSATVSPRDVTALVRWCLEGAEAIVEVDYNGDVLETPAQR